jgi:hypothetical protein
MLNSYPYLGLCLLMAAASGVAACLCARRERLRMVQSAALTAPVSAFAFVYIHEYRLWRNTSSLPFVSPATRLLAYDWNATNRPSAVMEEPPDLPFP